LHYAIVIDAGSSGSRVFLYLWPTPNPYKIVEVAPMTYDNGNLVHKKVTPGLSRYYEIENIGYQ
jgi:Golgi nucleoside diphosphatase